MEDYVRDANELARVSKSESNQLFDILRAPNGQDQAVDRENQINGLNAESATLAERAHDLDAPDELKQAHEYFLESLDLRRDGLAVVAKYLPGALAQEERRNSTSNIAGVMDVFLASDVLLRDRFSPVLKAALEREDVSASPASDETLTFVPEVDWLDPDYVADQIAGIRGSGGTATPGLHGNGLGTVALGGVALTPGVGATVQLTRDAAFDIQVVNQGDSTETDVAVNVTVGQGADALELEETIDEIAAGEAKSVSIPLTEQPPTGQNVPIAVSVKPVPGESVTDNNEGEFTVIFTR